VSYLDRIGHLNVHWQYTGTIEHLVVAVVVVVVGVTMTMKRSMVVLVVFHKPRQSKPVIVIRWYVYGTWMI
jgi:hypothetical protein